MEKIFLLLVLFQIKHFLADFPFQTEYMLGKFKDGDEWILPLAAHSAVHAAGTFLIAAAFTLDISFAFALAIVDFSAHFFMDRFKADRKYLGRFKSLSAKEFYTATETQKRHNKFFWWSIGFDQMVHHLTHYAIIACIVLFIS